MKNSNDSSTNAAAPNDWHPAWWKKDTHGSAWENVKEAFQRDWDQTKADFHANSGKELRQNAADTVKQAAGSAPIPPSNSPNAKPLEKGWHEVAPAVRYGFDAKKEYGSKFSKWDESLEQKLAGDWDEKQTGTPFKSALPYVRRGWDGKQ